MGSMISNKEKYLKVMANIVLESLAKTVGRARELASANFELNSDFGEGAVTFALSKATLAVWTTQYQGMINIPGSTLTRLLPLLWEMFVFSFS